MRLRRATIGLAALAVPVGLVTATGSAANAFAPNGGAEVFHENNDFTGVTSNALQSGFWGHEGSGLNGATVYSLGIDNGTGNANSANTAAALAKIGPDATVDNLRVAYVLTSSDGSAEKPLVTTGTAVGNVFTWFGDSGLSTTISGSNATNDSGTILSTQAQYDAWFNAGQHAMFYDDNLVAHNGDVPGNPVATAPLGSSILNTWPDGTHVSEVFYVSAGYNAKGEDTVQADSSGHAEVAWQQLVVNALPSDHSKDPASGLPASYDSVRTSALWTDLSFGVPTVGTTTTLSSSPASPQTSGTNVTFTAHVAPASGSATPTGTVTFKDGVNTLGTGTIDGSGNATFSTTALGVGDHSITANYPGATGFGSSSSSAATYHINGVVTGTTTHIAVSNGPTVDTPVTLTATVSPSSAPGSVQFLDGTTPVGTGTLGAPGVYSLTFNASPGTHTYVAKFTPTDPTAFGASQDTASPVTLGAGAVAPDVQTIQAEIPAGSLILQTPYTPANPLDVGQLALNSAATQYSGSKTFSGIQVTDTRAGDLPWSLNALAGALTNGSGGSINGENVGLTGLAVDPTSPDATAHGVTFTDNPAADPAVEPADTGTAGLGGGSSHPVAHANLGLGAWSFHGTLTINAPADTPPGAGSSGVYTGTVTFTVS